MRPLTLARLEELRSHRSGRCMYLYVRGYDRQCAKVDDARRRVERAIERRQNEAAAARGEAAE